MATVSAYPGKGPAARRRVLNKSALPYGNETEKSFESSARAVGKSDPPGGRRHKGSLLPCDDKRDGRAAASERFALDYATATVFGVSRRALLADARGGARVARVRQVAMYLAHIALGKNLSEAARLYGRDRTTAAHACSIVEDLRENAAFDRAIAELERVVPLQVRRSQPEAAR